MIRETLELDLSSALHDVDRLGSSLEDTAATFRDDLAEAVSTLGDLTVAVVADTSQFEDLDDLLGEFDEDLVIPVDADVEQAEAELSAIEAELLALSSELSTIDLTVDPGAAEAQIVAVQERATELQDALEGLSADVDTGDAESALDELTTAAGELNTQLAEVGATDVGGGGAIEGIAGISAGLEGLTSVSQLGVESFGALAETLGDSLPKAVAPAVAGLGAVLVATQQLFTVAVDAQAKLQAFNIATGEFADNIRNLHVAGLTGDLGDLATTLGSDDEALLVFNQRMFQAARSSGFTGEQAADLSQRISVLAANAVALNPALGDVADVAQGLSTAVARGGRFLSQYGISLTSAEINARALADTGKTSVAALTQQEKAAAGVALAYERLGDSIKTNIEEGAKNPAIQLRSLQEEFANFLEDLGASIPTETVFDLLRTTLPILKSVSSVVASVGGAVIPILNEIFTGFAPAIDAFGAAFAEGMKEITPSLTELTRAFVQLNVPLIQTLVVGAQYIPPFAEGLAILITGFADLIEFVTPTIQQIDVFTRQLELLGILGTVGRDANEAKEAIAEVPGVIEDTGEAAAKAAADVSELQGSFLGIVDAQEAYEQSLEGITEAQRGVTEAQRAVTDAQEAQRDAVEDIATAQRGYESALRDVDDAERARLDSLDQVVEAERRRVESLESVAEAQRAVAEAEAELARAQAGTLEEDALAIREARVQLAEAEARQAKLSAEVQEEATDRIILGEEAYGEALQATTEDQEAAADAAREREKADIATSRARLGLRDAEATAAGRVGEAERKLADARDRLSDAQRGQIEAAKQVEAAQRAVGDAALRVVDAQDKARDAFDGIGDAQDRAREAGLKVVEAQQKVRDAVNEVADAQQQAARRALEFADAQLTLQGILRENPAAVDALIARFQALKEQFPDQAPQFDALIARLQEARNATPIGDAGDEAGKGFADRFLAQVDQVPGKTQTSLQNGFREIDWAGLARDFVVGLDVIWDAVFWSIDLTKQVVATKGQEIGTALVDGFNEKRQLISDTFSTVRDTVEGAVGDARDWLFDVGRNILDGMFQGITDRLTELTGFMGSLRDGLVEAFKKAFGISSPAKVMIPIGEQIGAGVQLGIEQATPDVVSVAEQIVRDAAAAIDLSQIGPQLSGALTLAPGAGVGGGVTVGEINMPMTFAAGTTPDQARQLGAAAMDGALSQIATAVKLA